MKSDWTRLEYRRQHEFRRRAAILIDHCAPAPLRGLYMGPFKQFRIHPLLLVDVPRKTVCMYVCMAEAINARYNC